VTWSNTGSDSRFCPIWWKVIDTDLRRILIVDNCTEDREYAKRLLTKATEFTWQFTEASDGKEGLALVVSGTPFECLLVDYRLQDMDGIEFLQRLPQQFGEPGVAVVVLTGAGDETLAVRAMKSGAQDYLSKRDLDAKLLRRTVEYSITRFQLTLANRQSAKLLEEAHRELESFTYSVSHDLHAPLRHIAGFSDILIKEFGPGMDVRAREFLQLIADGAVRMGLLVDGLLSLAKLDQHSLQLRRADLNAVVDQVVAVLQRDCKGRVVEWRIACLPALTCDRLLITQVFQNLISNALKYSRGRSSAVIEIGSIEKPDEPPVIFVRDNGAGFDMTHADRLFGMFQRMHTEAEFEGTGIGLATVQRIIARHGGRIWAEAAPDIGATFYFMLGEGQ
jgi:signal transduction histidine kinase